MIAITRTNGEIMAAISTTHVLFFLLRKSTKTTVAMHIGGLLLRLARFSRLNSRKGLEILINKRANCNQQNSF